MKPYIITDIDGNRIAGDDGKQIEFDSFDDAQNWLYAVFEEEFIEDNEIHPSLLEA